MNRQLVSSSNIRAIGYDPFQSILEIEFNDGSLYAYEAVPVSIYQGLMAAASHGRYFHAHIRSQYRTVRLR